MTTKSSSEKSELVSLASEDISIGQISNLTDEEIQNLEPESVFSSATSISQESKDSKNKLNIKPFSNVPNQNSKISKGKKPSSEKPSQLNNSLTSSSSKHSSNSKNKNVIPLFNDLPFSDLRAIRLLETEPKRKEWKDTISLYMNIVKQVHLPAIDQELYFVSILKEKKNENFIRLLNIIRALEEHKRRTCLVIKVINERESVLNRIKELEDKFVNGELKTSEVQTQGFILLQQLQLLSLKCVELIIFWRQILTRPWPFCTKLHERRVQEWNSLKKPSSQKNEISIDISEKYQENDSSNIDLFSSNYLIQLILDVQQFEKSSLSFILPTKKFSNFPLFSPFATLGSSKYKNAEDGLLLDSTQFTKRLIKGENIILKEKDNQHKLNKHLKIILSKGYFVPLLNTPHVIEACHLGVKIDDRFHPKYHSIIQSLPRETVDENEDSDDFDSARNLSDSTSDVSDNQHQNNLKRKNHTELVSLRVPTAEVKIRQKIEINPETKPEVNSEMNSDVQKESSEKTNEVKIKQKSDIKLKTKSEVKPNMKSEVQKDTPKRRFSTPKNSISYKVNDTPEVKHKISTRSDLNTSIKVRKENTNKEVESSISRSKKDYAHPIVQKVSRPIIPLSPKGKTVSPINKSKGKQQSTSSKSKESINDSQIKPNDVSKNPTNGSSNEKKTNLSKLKFERPQTRSSSRLIPSSPMSKELDPSESQLQKSTNQDQQQNESQQHEQNNNQNELNQQESSQDKQQNDSKVPETSETPKDQPLEEETQPQIQDDPQD